jgi:hypothetical protein
MQFLPLRMDHAISAHAGVGIMITIIDASIECYGPNDWGVVYRLSDGGISGRSIRSLAEAAQEVRLIKARSRGSPQWTSPIHSRASRTDMRSRKPS